MGLLTKLFRAICVSSVVFVGILLGPNPLPETAKFTELQLTSIKDLGKNAAENDLLNNAERLFENEIKGPESFAILNGELYTTLHGGFVAKVFDDQIVPVVKFGQPCVGWWEESKCGRPLGIKPYGNDHLIVADAYFGLYKYNTKTGKSENLVDKNSVIDGITPKTFNGVEVAKDGTIYWTYSSTDFTIEDGIFQFLADGSGGLVKYDPVTRKNVVLLKDLFFANGVLLSPDEEFLLVVESGHSRVLKFYLKGPNKFTSKIFIDGLPGVPDNLPPNGNRGLFIPLVMGRTESQAAAFEGFAKLPMLRNFIARVLSLVDASLRKVQKIYPNYYVQRAIHYVGHLESIGFILPKKTTILEVDWSGNVVRSYHCLDSSVSTISDVIAHNGYFYMGSPINNYLARVPLSKLGMRSPGPDAGSRLPPPTTTTRRPPPPPTTTTTTTRRPPPPTTTTTTRPPTTTTPRPPPTTRPPPPPTTRPPPPTTTTSRPTTTTPRPTAAPRTKPPNPDPPARQSEPQRKP